MTMKAMLTILAVLVAIAAPRQAVTNNGIVEDQFSYNEVHYDDCLGEEIEHEMTITSRTHFIERQNGGAHQVINWFIEGYTFGLSSEQVWYTRHAPSPWVINMNDAQSSQGWNLQIIWKPVDGGRQFRESWRLRVVTDANGEPRVVYDGGVQSHCTGR